MRHRKRTNKLGRTVSHRKALFRNLSRALILNGRIKTTMTKAKALRGFFEPLVQSAKVGDVAARRRIAKVLVDRSVVKKLCDEIAPQLVDRHGGYLRVTRCQSRKGDNAEMAIVEIMDYEPATVESS